MELTSQDFTAKGWGTKQHILFYTAHWYGLEVRETGLGRPIDFCINPSEISNSLWTIALAVKVMKSLLWRRFQELEIEVLSADEL